MVPTGPHSPYLGIGKLLATGKYKNAARIGTVAGVVACAILTIMLIVQGAVMVRLGQLYTAAQTDADRNLLVTVYRSVRVVDQGMDLAFDVFFFSGWSCLAIAMLGKRGFGRVLPALILLIFAIDTPVQLYYAPTPPPFDVGPFGGLLLLVIFAQAWFACRRMESSPLATAAAQGG